MQTELKHIQRQTGTTFLYVTHDQEEALTMSDRIAVMNRGRLAQCDAPESLFRRPRTRFVADFFRGCNVLDAELLAVTGASVRVALGGRRFSVALDGVTPGAGAKLGLAIRAEHLLVGKRAEACEQRIEARLDEIVYRGTNVDHLLTLDDGQRLVATSTRREVAADAGRVAVGFDRDHVVPLSD